MDAELWKGVLKAEASLVEKERALNEVQAKREQVRMHAHTLLMPQLGPRTLDLDTWSMWPALCVRSCGAS